MKGMIALRKLLALLLAVLLLCGCSAVSPATEPPETTAAMVTNPVTEPPTAAHEPPRKIVAYDPDGDPIYEDELVIPEPTKYDEYGALYRLVEGTFDEYYMSEDYVEVVETPESTAFEEISYYHFQNTLFVVFRTSGAYIYYDVEPEVWNQFKRAESKGGFFNEVIKGNYEYEKE